MLSLSHNAKAIIKATTPFLEEKGIAVARRMYEILFERHPELKQLFANTHHDQPTVLAQAIIVYCNNIDSLDSFTQAIALTKAVDKISTAHVNAHVKPEHYPLVGAALLQAIQDILGDAATPEILAGWQEAYTHLASILVRAETEKYAKAEKISALF